MVAETRVTTGRYRLAASVVGGTGLLAALWLLLFAGPALFNAHRDGAALLALLVYIGVPALLAWGGPWLWRFIVAGEPDHE